MSKTKKRIIHLFLTLGLVAVGALGLAALTAGKPSLEKQKPPVPVPMVRTIKVRIGPQPVHILGEGTVRPLRQINLVPQVSGKVIYSSPALVDGGEFKQGDTLLRLEPVDYQLAVILAKAQVKASESNLKLVREEAAVAREEWRLHGSGRSREAGTPPPLVVKEPQLAAARARLEADRANLEKALLNLKRTKLKAPFDGRVSQKNVDIGQFVSPGQVLAGLYSIEAAEIVLPLEDKDLFWFQAPGFTPGEGPGSLVVVRAKVAGREMSWPGRVVRTQGKLDERTRMVSVVVRVEKPYAQKPPLAVGLFVTAHIQGRTLPQAALIPRSALRQGGLVWVVDEGGRLHFRKVEAVRFQGDEVLVKAGLKDGEIVVISSLKAVTDGMMVRSALIERRGGS